MILTHLGRKISLFTYGLARFFLEKLRKQILFFLVISGKIMILKPFSAKIVREYGAGEVFGIPEVLLGEEWKFMAEAKTFSSIYSFPKDLLFNRIEMMDSKPKKIINCLLPQA